MSFHNTVSTICVICDVIAAATDATDVPPPPTAANDEVVDCDSMPTNMELQLMVLNHEVLIITL